MASGNSRTLDSKHLIQSDGFSHAVDLVAFVNGKQDHGTWAHYYKIAAAMHAASKELGIDLRWGGVWDRRLHDLPGDPAGLAREVNSYAIRQKAKGKSALLDGPHFEL
ncbi:hypothetical protein [Brevundimonas sp.]|uniref:hypothetical protein n=1 Tax=Brevundimonas sp. TaxID=1871086 RepID=UPI0028B2070C|nr:hypothetical protein [Brevundimonas sp.]